MEMLGRPQKARPTPAKVLQKAIFVILADALTLGDTARVLIALERVKQMKERGRLGRIAFDGAGTKWAAMLAHSDHPYHAEFRDVRGSVLGVCAACAKRLGVADAVTAAGLELLSEHECHPCFPGLTQDGYEVVAC